MSDSLRAVRLVVFDLDDTLYAERQYVYSGFEAVAAALAGPLGAGADLAERMKQLFEAGQRGSVFEAILAESGQADAARWLERMIRIYRYHEPHITLFADAEAALTALAGRYRLAVLTDGEAQVQRRKIRRLGLQDRLDRILLTDELGRQYWKPHPCGFASLQEWFGLDPARCLYVADNPSKDFVGPNRLGWRTVMVRRPGGLYADLSAPPGGQPQGVIGSLADLVVALQGQAT